MKSTAHLSSARVYSILMLLAVYLGFNLATSYARRVGLLQEARQAFAIEFLRSNFTNEFLRTSEGPIPARQITGAGWAGATRSDSKEGKDLWLVSVKRSTGRQWESLVDVSNVTLGTGDRAVAPAPQPGESEQPGAQKNVSASSEALTNLRRIALELGLKDFDHKEYNLILRDIELEVVDREVTVPGIDLAFKSDLAPWIISILTIGFLLLIRNQVEAVMLDKELALDEPWIIVDNSKGLERLVSEGWLISVWLAPWIVTGCLLVIVTGNVVADGGIASRLRTAVVTIATIVLVLLGGWASLTTTASLLRLRRLRHERLSELLRSTTAQTGP